MFYCYFVMNLWTIVQSNKGNVILCNKLEITKEMINANKESYTFNL